MTFSSQYLFVVLCCCSLLGLADLKPSTTQDWKIWYSEVFDRSDVNLTETALLDRLMLLHKKVGEIDEGDPQAGQMRARVEQVYSLLTDTSVKHCNAKHMDDVREQFRQIKDPFDGNWQTMLSLVHQNMLEICKDLHSEVDRVMTKEFDEEDIMYLIGFSLRYENWYVGAITDRELRRILLDLLMVDLHATKDKIIARWDRSACGKALRFMKKPEMQPFADFIKLDLYLGMKGLLHLADPLRGRVRIINACTQLDGMIRSMPETRQRKRDKFTRFFKTCAVGSAC